MRVLKLLALVLGSAWLFPVSCTLGGVVGTQLIAAHDARDTRDGETLHRQFSFVTPSRDKERPFAVHALHDMEKVVEMVREAEPGLRQASRSRLLQEAGYDFLMPVQAGAMDQGDSHYAYRVLEQQDDAQLIEVVEAYHDGDNTIWSVYRASRHDIEPLTSRMFYFGYGMAAMPYAFAFGIVVYAVGRLLRRWLAKRRLS